MIAMMLYPAMNKLTEYIPNRYMMVNVVARRARQIAAEAEANGEHLEEKPVTEACLLYTSTALAELEAERCPSLDRPADAFAVLLAGAAQGIADPVKRRVAEQLLYHLGRWVYLVDAADDLKEDLKTGSYNPLVQMCIRDSIMIDTSDMDFDASRELLLDVIRGSVSN